MLVSRFLLPYCFSSLLLIEVTAPVKASLFFWKIPVTTTSPSVLFDFIVTLRCKAAVPCGRLTVTSSMPT